MERAPKFAVDIMLGKLAKWLRLMGFDSFYSNKAEDDFLMELTGKENRILLTRDGPLVAKMGSAAYFVQNIFLQKQLKEVTTVFQLYRFHQPRRCSVCNGILVTLSKSRAKKQVPPYVFQTQKHFFQCKNCKRVYWNGTHIQHIEEMMSGMTHETADTSPISPGKDDA